MTRFADIAVRGATQGRLDASAYHPLEHSLIDCSDRVKHARLWWSYFGQERFEYLTIGAVYRLALCRVNKHYWLSAWDLEDSRSGEVCNWCEISR